MLRDEQRELLPHDALPLGAAGLITACGPSLHSTGCESVLCRDCPAGRVGREFCDGELLKGCLLATHTACGVGCEIVTLANCDLSGCGPDAGGPACATSVHCDRFDCTPCMLAGDGQDPRGAIGKFYCEGPRIRACGSMLLDPISGCGELCAQSTTTTCAADCLPDGGPHCPP